MGTTDIIMLIVIIVLVGALFLLAFLRGKKRNAELKNVRDNLKQGDKVMTDTGVVGVVDELFKDGEYNYVVLKTGRGEHVGYFTVHANAIYYVFEDETKKPAEPIVEEKK